MNVSLTPQLESWVQSRVSSGFYTSSSEVVREALRLMADYEREKLRRVDALKSDILIALDQVESNEVVDFDDEELENIKKEARSQI